MGNDLGEALLEAFSKLTGAPIPRKMNSKNRKRFVEDSLNWLRNNDPGRLDNVDEKTAETITNFAGIPYERQLSKEEEERRKAMEDALEWIRNNDPKVDEEPRNNLVIALSKLTGASLPKMKPKEKKKFVEDS